MWAKLRWLLVRPTCLREGKPRPLSLRARLLVRGPSAILLARDTPRILPPGLEPVSRREGVDVDISRDRPLLPPLLSGGPEDAVGTGRTILILCARRTRLGSRVSVPGPILPLLWRERPRREGSRRSRDNILTRRGTSSDWSSSSLPSFEFSGTAARSCGVSNVSSAVVRLSPRESL